MTSHEREEHYEYLDTGIHKWIPARKADGQCSTFLLLIPVMLCGALCTSGPDSHYITSLIPTPKNTRGRKKNKDNIFGNILYWI